MWICCCMKFWTVSRECGLLLDAQYSNVVLKQMGWKEERFLSKFDTVKVMQFSEGCQTESQNNCVQSAEHPNMLQPSQWNSQVCVHAVLQLSYNTSHTSIATQPRGVVDKQFTALSQTMLFKASGWSAKVFYGASLGHLKKRNISSFEPQTILTPSSFLEQHHSTGQSAVRMSEVRIHKHWTETFTPGHGCVTIKCGLKTILCTHTWIHWSLWHTT